MLEPGTVGQVSSSRINQTNSKPRDGERTEKKEERSVGAETDRFEPSQALQESEGTTVASGAQAVQDGTVREKGETIQSEEEAGAVTASTSDRIVNDQETASAAQGNLNRERVLELLA